jgi:hypothetical protein
MASPSPSVNGNARTMASAACPDPAESLPRGRRAASRDAREEAMDRVDPHHAELIARLLANPGEVDTLSDDEVVSQLLVEASMRHTQLASLQVSLLSRLMTLRRHTPLRVSGEIGGDRLLSVEKAARILNVTAQWLYRHAYHLPFARRFVEEGPSVFGVGASTMGCFPQSRIALRIRARSA